MNKNQNKNQNQDTGPMVKENTKKSTQKDIKNERPRREKVPYIGDENEENTNDTVDTETAENTYEQPSEDGFSEGEDSDNEANKTKENYDYMRNANIIKKKTT